MVSPYYGKTPQNHEGHLCRWNFLEEKPAYGKVCWSPLLVQNEFVNTHPIVTHDAEAAHVGFEAPFLCFKVTGGLEKVSAM